MKITLPLPPTDNHYYTVSRGRKILSKKGRAYKELVYLTVKAERMLTRRVEITIITHHKIKCVFDTLNYTKSVCDVLKGIGAYRDDSQIDKAIVIRGNVVKGGRVDVYLKEMDGGMFDNDYLLTLIGEEK